MLVLFKKLNSLYAKVALTVVFVLLFFFLIFIINAKKTGKELLNQLMCARAHSLIDLTESALAKAMIEGKYHGMQTISEGIVNSANVKEIFITDMEGNIVVDAHSKNIKRRINFQEYDLTDSIHNFKYSINKQKGIYYLTGLHPIERKNECKGCHTNNTQYIGYLVMGITMADIQEYAELHQKSNVLLTILTLMGTGIALFTIISLAIVNPIKKLSLNMQNVSSLIKKYGKGEVDRIEFQTNLQSSSEINNLQNSLKDLIDELNRTYNHIKEIHSNNMKRADQLAIVGELAASIAHEIKNPVAGVQSAIEILKSELAPDDPNIPIFEEMHIQLNRVNKAVNDLLNYAKPSKPNFVKSDVAELIKKSLTLLMPQLQSKNIQLEYIKNGDIFEAEIDEKLIQQVIFNIVMNAMDAVNDGGKIKIQLSNLDSKLILKISDNGNGIPEEIKQNIFKPFFTTKHKGTGLGLAISKQIIEQHSGSIALETNHNEDTTFIISLPVRRSI